MNIHKKAKKGNKYNATLYPKICPQIVSDYNPNCTTTVEQLEIAFLFKFENCFKSEKLAKLSWLRIESKII